MQQNLTFIYLSTLEVLQLYPSKMLTEFCSCRRKYIGTVTVITLSVPEKSPDFVKPGNPTYATYILNVPVLVAGYCQIVTLFTLRHSCKSK